MALRKRFFILALAAALCLAIPCVASAAQFSGSSSPDAIPSEGANVELSITVYNDGDYAMEKIAIYNNSSQLFSTTAGAVIDPGASMTFTQQVTVPASLVGTPITFDITWLENGETHSGSCSVTVLNSGLTTGEETVATALSAERSVSSSQVSSGEVITLTYTLTNSGTLPITGVTITDKGIAGSTPIATNVTVEPGVPYVVTYEYTMGSSTVTSGPVITFIQPDGTTGTISVEEKTLGMIKSRISVEVKEGAASKDGQTFTLILTNNGNQRISDIRVTDELGNAVNAEAIALAIGESTSLSYTVPTSETRNVVFYIKGEDATGTDYEDHTSTHVVREYIDPSLIGISFSAAVVGQLDETGSISIDFAVENSGSLVMQNLVLSEAEYGTLYLLDTVNPGIETINQRMEIGSPRALSFTLQIEDPSGNVYSYTAHITADYVGTEPSASAAADIELADNVVSEVGSSVSNALRTFLIVLIVLTAIAGVALIVLSTLEREERKRMAHRRAQREKMLRQQALEQGYDDFPSGDTRRIPAPGAPGGASPSGRDSMGSGWTDSAPADDATPSGDTKRYPKNR